MNKRSSLSMLSAYHSSDSSGEDESLDPPSPKTKRHCPSLENERDKVNNSAKTPKVALPVPTDVLNLYNDRIDAFAWKDDASKHDGRTRSFPHEPGVWASYVFASASSLQNLADLVHKLCSGADFLKPNDAKICHISLSKTVKLRHHWIQPIADRLREKLNPFHPFRLFLGSLEVYTNEERTRTFLGLKVHAGQKFLKDLVGEVDECLKEYGLPSFYDTPSFHTSVAWCDTKHESELESLLPDFVVKLESFAMKFPGCRVIDVKSIYFRTGNKVFEFALSPSAVQR